MVMDVDGRRGADRGLRRPCHPHGGRPAGRVGAVGRHCVPPRRPRGRPDRLHLGARDPSLRARIARHYRETYACDVDPEQIIVTTGSSGAFILAFSLDVRAGGSRRRDRAGLSAVPSYPHGPGLRAGADRDHQRHPPCADRRDAAGGASQNAAEGRAGGKPGEPDRHDDDARGAGDPDRGLRKAKASGSSPTRSITASTMRFRP